MKSKSEADSNNGPLNSEPVGTCSLCGQVRDIKYVSKDLGSVCVNCEASDKDMWESLKRDRRKTRQRKRDSMLSIARRLKIVDRVEFPNEGTCLLDGRVYYYAQKQKARVKGQAKYYQMRGFDHFVKVFG